MKRHKSDGLGLTNRQIKRLIARSVDRAASSSVDSNNHKGAVSLDSSSNQTSEPTAVPSYCDCDQSSTQNLHIHEPGGSGQCHDRLCDEPNKSSSNIALERSDLAFHYVEGDLSYEDFLNICDSCDLCARCICFLSCEICKHYEHNCTHCEKCDKAIASAGDFWDNSEDVIAGSDTITENNSSFVNSVRNDLAEWAVSEKVSHAALKSLLGILHSHFPEASLPSDPRTLLGTVRTLAIRKVNPGHYWHYGIKKHLLSAYANFEGEEFLLSFNIDGLPISSSSNSALWPILCCVENDPHSSEDVFAAGIYHGYKKPELVADYLQDFVDECNDLFINGLNLGGRKVGVRVRCFICDAPGKAFCLDMKCHNGYFGCSKCLQKGMMINRRLAFVDLEFIKRSDENFIQGIEPGCIAKSPICSIPGIKPVTHFVLDPMHMLHLGVMKKLLMFWVVGDKSVKMGRQLFSEISEAIIALQPYFPREFGRKLNPLDFCRQYKSVEFRDLLVYVGPVIFRKLKPEVFDNYRVLHVAVRILSCPIMYAQYNEYANELLVNFVQNFKLIYGPEYMSYNIHGCLHIAEEALRYGPLDTFSAYKFENFMQQFKFLIRKGEKPLQQIAKRYSEIEAAKLKKPKHISRTTGFFKEHNEGPLVSGCGYPQYKVLKTESFDFNVKRMGDKCLALQDGSIILVENFAQHLSSGKVVIIGSKFRYKEELYASPCLSSVLGTFKVYGLSPLQVWSVDKISCKLFRMPYKDNIFVVVPLLHRGLRKF